MHNLCKHKNVKQLTGRTYLPPHDYLEWCKDCGATRHHYDRQPSPAGNRDAYNTRWTSPNLARDGHSNQCRDYE